jgi:hypothetical protein
MRAAPRQPLQEARCTASRTAGAGAVSTRAASSLLKEAAHLTLVMNLQFSHLTSDELTVLTPHRKAHGGGKRCQHEGCFKSARLDTGYCVSHGGGRRCQTVDCSKSALGDTAHCTAHGGGRRCQHLGCPKAAATGGTPHCKAHGAGKRCRQEGCSKSVAKAPGSVYCKLCLQREQTDDA